MTATAGILPEFMVAIYKNFTEGNLNKSLKLQLAILELIRKMKSVNFPQGFKEALSLRGINTGKPKMEFNLKLLSNLAHVKEECEFIMQNLLNQYFPQSKLKYYDSFSDNQFLYKELDNKYLLYEKSFRSIECIDCGKCEGDCNTVNNKDNSLMNLEENKQDLSKLVEEISRNILKNLNKQIN